MKKKTVAMILSTMMAVTAVAGCSGKSENKASGEKSYTIGISQFAEHGSLDTVSYTHLDVYKRQGQKSLTDFIAAIKMEIKAKTVREVKNKE